MAVIPAKAEALYNSEAGQSICSDAPRTWIPAFAGMRLVGLRVTRLVPCSLK